MGKPREPVLWLRACITYRDVEHLLISAWSGATIFKLCDFFFSLADSFRSCKNLLWKKIDFRTNTAYHFFFSKQWLLNERGFCLCDGVLRTCQNDGVSVRETEGWHVCGCYKHIDKQNYHIYKSCFFFASKNRHFWQFFISQIWNNMNVLVILTWTATELSFQHQLPGEQPLTTLELSAIFHLYLYYIVSYILVHINDYFLICNELK